MGITVMYGRLPCQTSGLIIPTETGFIQIMDGPGFLITTGAGRRSITEDG